MNRRQFLGRSAVSLGALASLPGFMARSWALVEKAGRKDKVLVVLFLRGAADALNILIPFKEPYYKKARPQIGISEPSRSRSETALDLDGSFGLHPALEELLPLYRAGSLSLVRCVGLPQANRSHFDAQDFMETGTPGIKSTPDGWMNRSLSSAGKDTLRAVALTQGLPRILRGRSSSVAFPRMRAHDFPNPRVGSMIGPVLEKMYSDSKDPILRIASEELFQSLQTIRSIRPQKNTPMQPGGNARNPLYGPFKEASVLIQSLPQLRMLFLEIGGWDHHAAEGGTKGQLANLLGQLGPALAQFARDLGDRFTDVVLVSLTEFGRTVRQNGSAGTDHGYGGFSLVMGGPVRGGSLFGDWPGLDPEVLYEGRDLPVTVDYRQVLWEILSGHMGLQDVDLVFPGFQPKSKLGIIA